VTVELNIHLENPLSTKTAWRELHKSNSRGKTAFAEPLITESNAQMRKRCYHYHKTWTWDNWKGARDMLRCVVFQAIPYIGNSLRLENT
jgi:hypothetical protein